MTAATLWELGVDPVWVRHAMAIATIRDCLVLTVVAFDTSSVTVLGWAGQQHVIDTIVTGSTEDTLSGVSVLKNQWLVDFVASCAVSLSDFLGVWLVALKAFRNDTVCISMAEVTSKCGVHARICYQLIIL